MQKPTETMNRDELARLCRIAETDNDELRAHRERRVRIALGEPMARQLALELWRRLPSSVSLSELEDVALLGLAEAARRYVDDDEIAFPAYAEKRMLEALHAALEGHDDGDRAAPASIGEALRAVCEGLDDALGAAPENEFDTAEPTGQWVRQPLEAVDDWGSGLALGTDPGVAPAHGAAAAGDDWQAATVQEVGHRVDALGQLSDTELDEVLSRVDTACSPGLRWSAPMRAGGSR